MNECKYRLPCGWCDRKNVECSQIQKPITVDSASVITPIMDAIKIKQCKNCKCATYDLNVSTAPKVKCRLTGNVHSEYDTCDCQDLRAEYETTTTSIRKES